MIDIIDSICNRCANAYRCPINYTAKIDDCSLFAEKIDLADLLADKIAKRVIEEMKKNEQKVTLQVDGL